TAMNAANGAEDPRWRLAVARYYDQTSDERARESIVTLADQQTTDLAVQRFALEAACTQSDKAFLDRTIERVHVLTGDRAVIWRQARAGWLLSFADDDKDVAKAAALLNEVTAAAPERVDPPLLLARAQDRLGNPTAAREQVQVAEKLRPESV